MYIVKNVVDNRVVYKHPKFDRYYVGGVWSFPYKIRSLQKAHEILQAAQYHWGGDHPEDWPIIDLNRKEESFSSHD